MYIVVYVRLPLYVNGEDKKQISDIMLKIQQQPKWNVDRIFIDYVDGLNYPLSNTLKDCIDYCCENKIGIIVVRDESRISRNRAFYRNILRYISSKGIRVWSAEDNLYLN